MIVLFELLVVALDHVGYEIACSPQLGLLPVDRIDASAEAFEGRLEFGGVPDIIILLKEFNQRSEVHRGIQVFVWEVVDSLGQLVNFLSQVGDLGWVRIDLLGGGEFIGQNCDFIGENFIRFD